MKQKLIKLTCSLLSLTPALSLMPEMSLALYGDDDCSSYNVYRKTDDEPGEDLILRTAPGTLFCPGPRPFRIYV